MAVGTVGLFRLPHLRSEWIDEHPEDRFLFDDLPWFVEYMKSRQVSRPGV